MIISITGHRIYDQHHKLYPKIYAAIKEKFQEFKPEKVISGLALGIDQVSLMAAYRLNIPVIGAIPCLNQDKFWNKDQKKIYQELLKLLSQTVYVSSKEYNAGCMQTRNEWMCNNSDLLLAVFDGTSGGTHNCIKYALSINKPIEYIHIQKL